MKIEIDPESLEPFIGRVVAETVSRLEESRAALPEERTYSEAEAARYLRVEPWVLRDERRRGRIQASKIMGKRIRYLRNDLIAYMLGRRYAAQASM